MTELEQILRQHAAKYPKMEPTDAVKLIYQNEFGGGHLIKDRQACLNYLRREYETVTHSAECPLYSSIGNGIVRVNLAALDAETLEPLGEAFISSAAEHTGSLDRFRKKLLVLCKLAGEGVFSFDAAALTAYLREYEAAGFPAVSHSTIYRKHYHPAYRIILAKYLPQL